MDIAQIKNNEDMQNLLLKFNAKTSSEEEKNTSSFRNIK